MTGKKTLLTGKKLFDRFYDFFDQKKLFDHFYDFFGKLVRFVDLFMTFLKNIDRKKNFIDQKTVGPFL